LYDINVPRLQQKFRAGMLICMDIEYPETARVYGVMGANLLIVPTAMACGPCEYLTPCQIVPTRALENHYFILYSNFISLPSESSLLSSESTPSDDEEEEASSSSSSPSLDSSSSSSSSSSPYSSISSSFTYKSTKSLQLSGQAIHGSDGVSCPPLTYCGRSAIFGPDGNEITRSPGLSLFTKTPTTLDLEPFKQKGASLDVLDQLSFAQLDLSHYIKDVIRNPYLYERRPSLYQILTEERTPTPGLELPKNQKNQKV